MDLFGNTRNLPLLVVHGGMDDLALILLVEGKLHRVEIFESERAGRAAWRACSRARAYVRTGVTHAT